MSGGRRLALALVAVALGSVIAVGISRIDVDDAIKEITLPLKHEDSIRQQASEKDLDAALIAAVINVESGFDADARSGADARGLMQVTPATAQAIADESGGTTFVVEDLTNSDINIRYGTYHLRDLLDQYDGNLTAALAAYNAGSGNVDGWGGALLELDDIRFPETRAYVEEVLEKRDQYRDNYADELGL
ncbi:MAG TPA: lytic transglycosylase domain-containing protein [Solirubrobacterales bacterium]|nr:lytic transglycosylase domain-containing protein [Solirubrobacterales bacterium]